MAELSLAAGRRSWDDGRAICSGEVVGDGTRRDDANSRAVGAPFSTAMIGAVLGAAS